MDQDVVFLELKQADGIDFAGMAFRKALPKRPTMVNWVTLLVTGRLRKLRRMMHNQVPFIILPEAARDEWKPRKGEGCWLNHWRRCLGFRALVGWHFEFPAARAAVAIESRTGQEATENWVQCNVVFLDHLAKVIGQAGSCVPREWTEFLALKQAECDPDDQPQRRTRGVTSPAVQEALNWLARSDEVRSVVLRPIPPAVKQFRNWISGLLGRNLIWAAGEVGAEVPAGLVLMGHDTIKLIGAEDSPIVMVAGLVKLAEDGSMATRYCNAIVTPDGALAYKSKYKSGNEVRANTRGFARAVVDPITASYLQLTGEGEERKLLLVRRNMWRSWWQEGPTMLTLLIGPLGVAAALPAVNEEFSWWHGLLMATWAALVLAQWIARVRRKGGAFRR